MQLRPSASPIDDRFFAAVRRRHPDVDVVLLPPTGRPAAGAEAVGDDGVAGPLARVATQTARLWAAIAPDADEEPDVGLGFGVDAASVRVVARVVARRPDGFQVLVRLRHELESRGRALRSPRGSGVERLTGVLDDLEVSASYAEQSGLLLLTVVSESVPVGIDRARHLTRKGAH